MRTYGSDVYFDTQSEALQFVYDTIKSQNRYEIVYPDSIWTEHVAYGTTVKYHLPLKVKSTGNFAKKTLHVVLYRMDSGKYELTFYKS
jgi:hypothetical protein